MPAIPSSPEPVSPGMSRRQQYSASTKRALVDVAEDLFTEHGYAQTSLDAIVTGARVTKGALYHHFSGKQALFEAVFEQVEADASATVGEALRSRRDPWEKAEAGLRAFLGVVQEPRYRRVVVLDGPAVLGHERYREREERSTFATVLEIVRAVLDAGGWAMEEELLQTFARIFFGALTAAGESVAVAEDPVLAAQRVEVAISLILQGFQALEAAGAVTPGGQSPAGAAARPARARAGDAG